MPYFVYQIAVPSQLTLVAHYDKYRDARGHTRSLRTEARGLKAPWTARLIFAGSPEEAEQRLREVREPRPLGEES